MKTVTLICGLPNAGKTTYSEQFDNVFHLDDFDCRTFKKKFDMCNKTSSKSETDVYVEGCYHRKSLRKEFIETFKDWKKVCIWFNTPLDVCLSRCEKARSEMVVLSINKAFQEPTKDEGWDELIVLDYDKI